MSLLREAGAGLVDLLFPPVCLTCGAVAPPFCTDCRSQINPVPAGTRVPAGTQDARSAGYHEGPLRHAVLRLKFERKAALARPLAGLLAAQLAQAADWRPDVLVPVPIHPFRRLERGFNQAELLAAELGRLSGLPVVRALRRTRYTPQQVGRSRAERQSNLHGAFAANPRRPIRGARVVLIDDVRTTGGTLSECARVLHAAGAREVFALTVTY